MYLLLEGIACVHCVRLPLYHSNGDFCTSRDQSTDQTLVLLRTIFSCKHPPTSSDWLNNNEQTIAKEDMIGGTSRQS